MEININWPAVIVAAISSFLVGGLWYSPMLLAKQWMIEAGLREEDLKDANMVKIFGLTFVYSFIMALNLAYFIADPSIDLQMGALYGFLTGFGWVAMSTFILSLFERRSWKYMLIHAGYQVISLTLMGAILGAWK
ncbi:MAG: hypothetical protein AMXMBFR48_28830 [Ignavibacteriales bacterium]